MDWTIERGTPQRNAAALAFVLVAMLALFAAVPSSAYAADISNSMSMKSSVKKGSYLTFKQKTTYAMWGIGPAGIPFESNWRTEISSDYFEKPKNTAQSGSVGTWKKSSSGRLVAGKQWVCQGPYRVFYGKTTWYATSKAKAKKAAKRVQVAHGQYGFRASEGWVARHYVAIKG